MQRKDRLSARERVRLALEHKETDRVPIAMLCSGINEPARGEFEDYLKRERGTDLKAYLDELFRKFILPHYKRFVEFLKSSGVEIVLVDTDGDHNVLIPVFLSFSMSTFPSDGYPTSTA